MINDIYNLCTNKICFLIKNLEYCIEIHYVNIKDKICGSSIRDYFRKIIASVFQFIDSITDYS